MLSESFLIFLLLSFKFQHTFLHHLHKLLRCNLLFRQKRQLVRELDTKPVRMDGGKVIKRPLLPFEEASGLESYHVDVFISGKFSPDPLPVGTVAYLTVLSGTAGVTVGEKSFQMLEWDAVRFPADQPWRVDNQSNSTVRLHLTYRYAKP